MVSLRKQLDGIDLEPEDLEELTASQTELSVIKDQLLERTTQLPPTLEAFHKNTAEEVARLELSLHATRAQLLFRDSEQSVMRLLSEAADFLQANHLPESGARLYGATSTAEQVAEFSKTEKHLAPVYGERADALLEQTAELQKQLDDARQRTRLDSGWMRWLEDDDCILPSDPELAWLQIEALLSRNDPDKAHEVLSEFAAKSPAGWQTRIAQARAELHFRRGRSYEQQGRLQPALQAYQDAAQASLDHAVVEAAQAAVLNLEEQIAQEHGIHTWAPVAAAGGLAAIVGCVVTVLLWRRTTTYRLQSARRCLQRAVAARSDVERDAAVHEAAYVLASLPPDDPRVAALWNQQVTQRQQQASARRDVAAMQISAVSPPQLPEIVDAALASEAALRLVVPQCLAWLNSPSARLHSHKQRTQKVTAWLLAQLEPRDADAIDELEFKLESLQACEEVLPRYALELKLYRLRALHLCGRFEDCLKLGGELSKLRLPTDQFEQFARILFECCLQLGRWNAADKCCRMIAKRKLPIPELRDWSNVVRAGLAQTTTTP